ncbi:MAG TPA: hypothetical protein VHM02_04815 [Thermoanaerobaculia bacterium]|nr:hypothetical protein [Thermoanaerobaculia bacterium]
MPIADPEAAAALPSLVERGLVTPDAAERILAVARGERVSARAELRWGLGAGVALVTAGLGLGIRANLDRLGPWTVAALLALAAAACFGGLLRRAPGFTRGRAAGADWIDDGLALLGLAFLGGLLAWIETRLAGLGDAWPWHLLVVAACAGAAAVRFDSRVAWFFALSSFAAWRGLALATVAGELLLDAAAATLRWNALAVAAVFAAVGIALRRLDLKAHFEPTTTVVAAALALGATFSGMLTDGAVALAWAAALAAVAGALVAFALRARRFGLFALAVLGLYAAATRLAWQALGADALVSLGFLWTAGSAAAVLVLLVWAQRRFRAEAG